MPVIGEQAADELGRFNIGQGIERGVVVEVIFPWSIRIELAAKLLSLAICKR